MSGGRRTKKTLWRWRSNPLRRRDDVLEAWVVLAVWVLIAVGGTFAGVVTARAAGDVFDRQRAEREPVRAVLLMDTPQAAANAYRSMAKVRWIAGDGSSHTGKALVESGKKAGSRVTLWTDPWGDLVTAPPSPTEAAVEAGLLGTAAALAASGLAFGAGGLARWRLERRRIAQWGREWDLVGPQWGHRTR
ncbi:hypothetical protein [Streptomyces sp. S.PB5]|uniref:Rv1733c family protein n=1 Tax=Streptomyces sp. S.PB5 TaxID=3020844 RepID=UPI0025B2529C|nr:hypothetical protein [Streptomyces sp. S.PB5]MDN3029275.1 hypothetical protein [Streptomyces sp. S.PB5]